MFPTHCERCYKATTISTCSMFNTQQICMECKKIEKAHPDYKHACEVELEECRRGNMNFPGIGLPADL